MADATKLKKTTKNTSKGKPPKPAPAADPIALNTRQDENKPKVWGQLNIKTADPDLPKEFKKWCVLNDLTMGDAFQQAFELLKSTKS